MSLCPADCCTTTPYTSRFACHGYGYASCSPYASGYMAAPRYTHTTYEPAGHVTDYVPRVHTTMEPVTTYATKVIPSYKYVTEKTEYVTTAHTTTEEKTVEGAAYYAGHHLGHRYGYGGLYGGCYSGYCGMTHSPLPAAPAAPEKEEVKKSDPSCLCGCCDANGTCTKGCCVNGVCTKENCKPAPVNTGVDCTRGCCVNGVCTKGCCAGKESCDPICCPPLSASTYRPYYSSLYSSPHYSAYRYGGYAGYGGYHGYGGYRSTYGHYGCC